MEPKKVVIVVLLCALVAVSVAFAVVASTMRSDAARLTAENKHLATLNRAYVQATSKSGHFTMVKDWAKRPHVEATMRGNPETCFVCHKETFCSHCHVRQLRP